MADRTFTATLLINISVPDGLDSTTALHRAMQNFYYSAQYEHAGVKITDYEVIGTEAVPEPQEDFDEADSETCGYCGHTKADHFSDNHYGPCWHGSGYGFTCPCRQFEEAVI